ncbi:helix-turn-helix transcriptional regulator [Streptomyces albus subsp. chlorinus]|uniref:helix-turn-helix domain-containing protein n=1 Tax=Streptomyces albus TaxID=1888 RepID=UPI00157051CC|nr:helix-turn-helix transcriptional regulator [Streptomyces albus]NSC22964.1 helix-turn-helix transcriptional regulator [Streptomyces albus subsp. chlorinus]
MDVPISITPADLGKVVRAARAAAGLTQVELGRRCGYSHSVISRIENGHVTPDWPTVARLATELHVAPEHLGLIHSGAPARTGAAGAPEATSLPSHPTAVDGEDAVRRRHMLTLSGSAAAAVVVGPLHTPVDAATRSAAAASIDLSGLEDALLYGPPPTAEEPTAAGVSRTVARAREALHAGAYRQLVAALPQQLALAEALAQGGEHPEGLSALYAIAARAAIKASDDRLLVVAADRAVQAARAGGHVLALAEACRMVSSGYRRAGRYDRAVQVAARAADELASDRNAPPAARASAQGQLLATAAYTAAKSEDSQSARELLAQAAVCANRTTEERTGTGWFGPRQVALHEVSVLQVLGDPPGAITAARRVETRGMPPERAARLGLDVARAFADWGRPEDCYRALLAVERAAPQEARRSSVHSLTKRLLHHEHRLDGVRDFARRTGAVAS